jgi:hypothetical protein
VFAFKHKAFQKKINNYFKSLFFFGGIEELKGVKTGYTLLLRK